MIKEWLQWVEVKILECAHSKHQIWEHIIIACDNVANAMLRGKIIAMPIYTRKQKCFKSILTFQPQDLKLQG